jgi:prevent-host-death family protein
MFSKVIPLTDARAQIGSLTDALDELKAVLLTKRGRPKAVLVATDYWEKIINQLSVLTQKTYIKKSLLPYTREFADDEINAWLKEDEL